MIPSINLLCVMGKSVCTLQQDINSLVADYVLPQLFYLYDVGCLYYSSLNSDLPIFNADTSCRNLADFVNACVVPCMSLLTRSCFLYVSRLWHGLIRLRVQLLFFET